MSEDTHRSFRSLKSLKAPGTFDVSKPLNQLKYFENTKDTPSLQVNQTGKLKGECGKVSSQAHGACILRLPESASKKPVILALPTLHIGLKELRAERIDSSEGEKEEGKERLKGYKLDNDDENQEEIFYETSPVLPTSSYLPKSDSFNNFELNEYINFKLDSSNILKQEKAKEKDVYYDSPLQENFLRTVDVNFEPMGEPLIPDSMPLNLSSLISDADQIMIRKSGPFCNIIDKTTFKLLQILEYEFDLVNEEEVADSGEHTCGWLQGLRRSLFGYLESEYGLLYPWRYLDAPQEPVDVVHMFRSERESEEEEEEEEEEEATGSLDERIRVL